MRVQDIEITIGPSGEVSFEIKGVRGSQCIEETRFLEEAIGEVAERERTAAYYQEGEAEEKTALRSGGEDED